MLVNMLVRFALNTTCCANMLGVEKMLANIQPTFAGGHGLRYLQHVGQHVGENVGRTAQTVPTCWLDVGQHVGENVGQHVGENVGQHVGTVCGQLKCVQPRMGIFLADS